jgi:TolA-binding protein
VIRFSIILLAALVLISGCVYYNTFFNAEKYFDDAQTMALRDNGKPSSTAIQNYNKTIKKCGIVLTDYKDSKYADDALYLMARCFYYIGRNYTQALKHFDELIEFYPESEFIPDVKLYIARANYQFTRKELAFELLQEFLQDPKYKDHHAKALQLLADYHLVDKNFVDADFYLNRIIEKFPKSEEYTSAFFLQGKNQYEAGNYEKSNEVFFSLLKSKVPRNIKFDARYYIALNYLMLEDYQEAEKFSFKLSKDEYREEMISKIHVIKARSLAGNAEFDDAIQLFNTVITDNSRTLLSAESAFYLGELYFNQLHDYEKAIESYGKVKKESGQSEFMEKSVTRSAVASQIIQFNNPDSQLAVEELVLQQFKLAEFYVEFLNMPDSALIVYDHITQQKDFFFLKLDTLRINLAANKDSLDLFTEIENILKPAEPENEQTKIKQNKPEDGKEDLVSKEPETGKEELVSKEPETGKEELVSKEPEFEEKGSEDKKEFDVNLPDSTELVETFTDSTNMVVAITDSTDMVETVTDSAEVVKTFIDSTYTIEYGDSIKTVDLAEATSEKLRLQTRVRTLTQQISRNEDDIVKYEEEFIPFAKFIKLWLYKVVYQDSARIQEQFDELISDFPDNKYTYAAELMLQDKKVEITTKKQILELAQYEAAIADLYEAPASTKVLLHEIAADSTHEFYLKANYSLGYVNHFLLADSVTAKQHYDIVLAQIDNNEFIPEVQKLYNGEAFKTLTRLPAVINLEIKLAVAEEAALKEAEEAALKETEEEASKSEEEKDSESTSKQKDMKNEELEKNKKTELEKNKIADWERQELIEKQKQEELQKLNEQEMEAEKKAKTELEAEKNAKAEMEAELKTKELELEALKKAEEEKNKTAEDNKKAKTEEEIKEEAKENDEQTEKDQTVIEEEAQSDSTKTEDKVKNSEDTTEEETEDPQQSDENRDN